ncbi:MAG: DUF3794 domain-containing protein [Clostridia bacterium]|nr:DUF3794 domain-containing protein [Clostridia bacterium]
MEMQLTREEIRLEQPLGTGRADAVVTGEVTLPGSLRDETRVLFATATAAVEQAEATRDRVNVRGRVMFHVLYSRGSETEPAAIEATADFTQPVALPGAQGRAIAQGRVQVQRVEARASGGRLNLRAEIAVSAQGCTHQPLEVITGVDGVDGVETKVHPAKLCTRVATGTGDVLLREELPLPQELQIRQTLFATAFPQVEDVSGGVGRVGISGHVLLEAVHASALPGRPVVVTRHSIPFTQSVEIAGGEGEQLDGAVVVRDVAVASQAEEDGLTLRAEVLLGLEGSVDAAQTLSVLEDAYTTEGDELRLTGQDVRLRAGSQRARAAESGKAALRLPDGAPPVRTVLAAFVQPVWEEFESSGDRTVVSGTLCGTLLYMTDGSEIPVSHRFSEPFRTTFAAQTGPGALLTLTATEAEATPVTSDRVEVRCVLRMEALTDEAETLRLITQGEVVGAEPLPDDLVLCYVQQGETLWDIARRYRVPVEGVRALNPELRGEVAPGMGVVVWRRPVQA